MDRDTDNRLNMLYNMDAMDSVKWRLFTGVISGEAVDINGKRWYSLFPLTSDVCDFCKRNFGGRVGWQMDEPDYGPVAVLKYELLCKDCVRLTPLHELLKLGWPEDVEKVVLNNVSQAFDELSKPTALKCGLCHKSFSSPTDALDERMTVDYGSYGRVHKRCRDQYELDMNGE